MKVLVIARREMAGQKLAWAAAGYVALAGAVAPWFKPLADSRGAVAVGLPLGFVVAMAAVLGASMIPADLAGGRLGFHLARPVRVGTLLLGRFLGAWLLAVGGGLVVALTQAALVPSYALGLAAVWAFSAVLAVIVLLAAHVLGTGFRSRSAWFLLDLASAGAFLAAMECKMERLAAAGRMPAMMWFMGGATVLGTAVLAAAVYRQLAVGGADLHRGHRVLSLTLAAGLAAVAVLGAIF
jgi:hypothetical protein